MRVISGIYRRRTINSLPGLEIRPTSDRLRETLFNVLCAGNPDALAHSLWLDLFAGTGAVGVEALSRGAGSVQFVDSSSAAAKLIAANLKSLGITSGFRIATMEARKALRQQDAQEAAFDFVFLDPPYSEHVQYSQTLSALGAWNRLREGSVVIAEHQKRFDPGEEHGSLLRYRILKHGESALSFYRKRT